jgi:hypothetical protein
VAHRLGATKNGWLEGVGNAESGGTLVLINYREKFLLSAPRQGGKVKFSRSQSDKDPRSGNVFKPERSYERHDIRETPNVGPDSLHWLVYPLYGSQDCVSCLQFKPENYL